MGPNIDQRKGKTNHIFDRTKLSISNISACGRRDRRRLMSGTSSTADIDAGQYCRAGTGYLHAHARCTSGGRNVATSTQQLRSLRSCASGWVMRVGACRITLQLSISSGSSSQRISAWMLRPRELNQHRQVLHPLREFVPRRLPARQWQLLPRRLRSRSQRRARRRMIR